MTSIIRGSDNFDTGAVDSAVKRDVGTEPGEIHN